MSDASKEYLRMRQRAYKLACDSPAIQEMMGDLAAFCHHMNAGGVAETDRVVDTNRVMIMVGRQQVFDRIARHLNLKTTDLYKLYTGVGLTPQTGDDDA
jgi:hypothetical protein